jgi:hypothetical protein
MTDQIEPDPKRLEAEVRRIAKQLQPCTLCLNPVAPIVAFFIPSKEQLPSMTGIPAIGKVRMVAYTLCEDCFAHSESPEVIEELIAHRWTGRS